MLEFGNKPSNRSSYAYTQHGLSSLLDSKGADTVPKGYQTYKMILKEYPDVVSVDQMCEMLSISTKTGYRQLKD